MCDDRNPAPGEVAATAATVRQTQAIRLALQHRRTTGFTLAELLVSVVVLVVLVFLSTQLINSATTVTILGQKRMDADSEARQVLDRMAIDFAQMVKRADVDYYVKLATQQRHQNDQIALYSAVPGYYPSSGAQSPISLLAYRVNSNPTSSAYNKMERLGKGLVWNGASTTDTPVVFVPFTISNTWPYATNQNPDPNSPSAYEVIGPDVFRFEYYYLLTNGALSDAPCLNANGCTTLNTRDVAAIVVDIAVIDPRSKLLLSNQQIATFTTDTSGTNFLTDWSQDLNRPGTLLTKWQNRLGIISRTQSLPRQAVSGVRLYERYFYLNQ
jgi:type II secretory pathway component PulJ